MDKINPPFRADHVGSLLRTPEVKENRLRWKNGEISAEEIANAATTLKTLDKNNDGVITEDEVRPTPGGGISL